MKGSNISGLKSQSRLQKKLKKDFLTVGIGASAGGVKALKDFFSRMPADSGMAFVVVLHLSQVHESNLAEILRRVTAMPVVQVTETIKIEPNQIYVIPPAQQLEMSDSFVRLVKPERIRGRRVAIDRFFQTLADSYGESAVAIVLSGSGEDGTYGIRKIKEANGFAIVQKPEDAEYEQMPQSAIGTGLVDWILPIEEMPPKLLWLRDSTEDLNLLTADDSSALSPELKDADALREILTVLRVRTGHDFSNYKHPTLLRRIARHLQIHELEDLASYSKLMREKPEEADFLLNNLLINVTSFFRNSQAFQILEENAVPRMFAGKNWENQLRVWVAGCATGEEAFSIAILLREYAAKFEDAPKIQIFASDVDEQAIAAAREGVYGECIVDHVSPERVKRYFKKEANRYRVKKELREMILFAPHNILRDPPFSKLDLIACRNLMIYLNREAQERLLQLFHFALRPDGVLFLGSSESAESAPLLFAPLDQKNRIYVRRATNPVAHPPLSLPVQDKSQSRATPVSPRSNGKKYSFSELHFHLLEKYAPPSVLVNEDYEIVHLSENAGRYLHFVGGEPTNNLLKVVHPDLRADLRAALFTAKQDGRTAIVRRLPVGIGGADSFVNLSVHPSGAPDRDGVFLLVLFEETKSSETVVQSKPVAAPKSVAGSSAIEALTRQLEEELQRTKDRLLVTVEQYDSSIEELKAANEELQAINEELHSATEELETSREELQSVNEELTTVNTELNEKIDEISHINADWQNLMRSTDIGVIFLDRELRIKSFTPHVREIFNIIQSDAGRPFEHLTHRLNYKKLSRDTAQVLQSLRPIEREVKSDQDKYFLVRLLPYRTLDDKIDGVVLTFTDITERRRAEEATFYLASVVQSSKDSIITVDLGGKITSWNPAAESLYGYPARNAIGKLLATLELPEDIKEALGKIDKIKHSQATEVFDSVSSLNNGQQLNLEFVLSPVKDAAGQFIGVSSIARDVTERKQAEQKLSQLQEGLVAAIAAAKIGTWNLDLTIDVSSRRTARHDQIFNFDAAQSERARDIARQQIVEEDLKIFDRAFERALKTGDLNFEVRVRRSGETIHWMACRGRFYFDENGVPIRGAGVNFDITDRKRAEEKLRESEAHFRAFANLIPDLLWSNDPTGYTDWCNQQWFEYTGQTLEESLGYGWLKSVHPDDRDRSLLNFQTAINTGEPLRQKQRIRRYDGEYRWFLVQARPMREDGDGKVLRWFGAATDIHDSRSAEDFVRESEDRLRLIVESVEDYAIFTLTPDNKISSWNRGAERIFGYDEKEILGEIGEIIFTPEDRENREPEKEIRTAIENGSAADERWHIRKDNSQFYASGVLTVLGDSSENGFVKILRDLTSRKQFEEALRESDRRKDEFLATLSHELRNPLAPIRTALEVMRLGADEEKVGQAREIIERQTDQLVRLVDDLLDIARITEGKIQLRTERIDIADSIGAAIETIQPFIKRQSHRLDLRLPDKPLFVEADPARLTQIVLNLLHNSAKYTEPGGHILLIAASEGNEAVIRIRDNGIGIQLEMLPEIFDIFAQTAAGKKSGNGGLGIGLSLVKKLVEMHGGRIEAQSEGEGKGSEFIVRLPLAASQKNDRKPEKQKNENTPPAGDAKRVLVVDDNADAAKMLEVFLSLENHEVRTAHTGREALHLANDFQPNAIILDISLPDIDGYEVAKRVREKFPEVRLIALSGWAQEDDRRRSNEAGFDRHLAKPVNTEELKRALRA